MIQCPFLAFPECICSTVLVDWLLLNDVARMDDAFCSRALRHQFSCVAYHGPTVYKRYKRKYGDQNFKNIMNWCIKRGAKLDFLNGLSCRHEEALVARFLASCGPFIRRIEERADLRLMKHVGQWCQHVRYIELELEQNSDVSGEGLQIITSVLRELQTLNVRFGCISSKNLAQSLVNCQALTALNISHVCVEIPPEVALPSLLS